MPGIGSFGGLAILEICWLNKFNHMYVMSDAVSLTASMRRVPIQPRNLWLDADFASASFYLIYRGFTPN